MARKGIVLLAVVAFALSVCGSSFAADKKEAPKAAAMAVAAPGKGPASPGMPARPAFGMLAGTLTKIDNSDAANVKLEVKNDRDNTIHTVTLMPWTNITKSTDVSDLKVGEPIRVMSRKDEGGKEIAMGVMFGKFNTPPPPAARPAVAVQQQVKAAAPAVKAPVKK